MDGGADGLVRRAESNHSSPADVRAALDALLVIDRASGIATAFGLLSREPRIKPSRGLLIDPTDAVHRRWLQRVAAGRALVASPAVAAVFAEVRDELAASAEFAGEVLDGCDVHPGLSAEQRAALLATRR